MARHNEIGKIGEDAAVQMLIGKGYAICERNWRSGNLEIDIIAMYRNRVVFVEVKTRTGSDVYPAEAVDRRRMLRMARAAENYIRIKDIPHEVQFDIFSITVRPDATLDIDHIPDAFLPPMRSCR